MEHIDIVKNSITSFHGPMFAGKSETLIKITEEFTSVDAFQPLVHTRDGLFIKSRNGKQSKCKLIDSVEEVMSSKSDLIVIDEYQHFDSEMFEKTLIELKRTQRMVIIAGLNINFNIKYKHNFELLQKYSDKIVELYAKCTICDKPAQFSHKLYGEKAKMRIKLFKSSREPRCETCNLH